MMSGSDDFFDSDSDIKKREPRRQGFENDRKKSSGLSSDASDDEESFRNTQNVNRNGSSKLQKLKVHLPSEEQPYNSDDSGSSSVTDVSSLPSSDSSPKRKNSTKSINGSRKMSTGKSTKASKSNKAIADLPRARRSKGVTLSVDDLDCTSDSNSISSEQDDDNKKRPKLSRKKKVNYDELHHRMEASTRHHRRRLLDVAAQNSMDISQLLEVVLEMEQEEKRRKALSQDYPKSFPQIRHTRSSNKSFSRNRARDIEIENERLYRRIAQHSNSSKRPSSASSVRSFSSCQTTSSSTSNRRPATAMGTRQRPSQATRLYHSATNRIRDQQRIEQENLAFLRRLQGARASNDLRRDVLLQDYERQTGKTVYSAKPRQRRSMKRSTRQMQQAGRQTWQDSW